MTLAVVAVALAIALLLAVVSSVHMLYRETMRLRAREAPAIEYFKQTVEPCIGLTAEQGALSFSLLRQLLIVFLAVLAFAVSDAQGLPMWRRLLEAMVLGGAGTLLAATVLPQLLAHKTSGRWLAPWLPALRLLCLLIRPVVAGILLLQSLAEEEAQQATADNGTPYENIEALISAGAEEGLIEEQDRKLIQSVVAFGDKTVRDVMTPRPKMVAIREEATLEDLRKLVIHEKFSRIPVYRGSVEDGVVGFVHVHDLFEGDRKDHAARRVGDVMRPVRHVPESKPVSGLMREMQQDGSHVVIVVDEYGKTAGLVTLEDVVEQIVGEIRDEHEPDQDFVREPGGSYVVAGSFEVGRLPEMLGCRLGDQPESATVGGLVTEWLGHVPSTGEFIERGGIRIEILAGDERRVDAVRIARLDEKQHAVQ